jgi:hypothetical protein
MSKLLNTIIGFALVVGIWAVARYMELPYAFPVVLALMLVFYIFLGIAICNQPLGILINEQNVVSLARFQTALWSLIIVSAFVVIAFARIRNGVLADENGAELADPLNIALGKDLLGLIGISAASFVGSPLIAATKRSKPVDKNTIETVANATAKEMVRLKNIPDSVKATTRPAAQVDRAALETEGAIPPTTDSAASANVAAKMQGHIATNAEGILYKNPQVSDASFEDMFEGNEIGNAAHVDLGKVQMFFFTVVVSGAYLAALWDVISAHAIYGANFAFPALSGGMVTLLGISNAGYLAAKGVDHTPKSPKSQS